VLDRSYRQHSADLRQLEAVSSDQLTRLDYKTRALQQELCTSLEAVRTAERAERDKLETRVVACLQQSLAQLRPTTVDSLPESVKI